MIGVPLPIFESEYEPPNLSIYQTLEEQKPARTVRNLCILRTEVLHRFRQPGKPSGGVKLFSLSDCAPADCLDRLYADGVFLSKTYLQPAACVIEINRLLAEQIDSCRDYFPLWFCWEYVRDIFIMPNGLTESGVNAAAALYQKHRPLYPYQMYINWRPVKEGNILFSDMKFAVLLYRWNGDEFTDLNKVSDGGQRTEAGVEKFLEQSKNTVIVVDCENSDPYKLCAALRGLGQAILARISKIVLYDDSHTTNAWQILNAYISCPVEHIMIDRVKKQKSLVDIRLTAGACKEFYQNGVDSFILVSSDSDYWGLISSLPDARFLVIAERDHVSGDLKATMDSAGVSYCYLDDFYCGDSGDIQTDALLQEIRSYLENSIHLNVNDMMDYALRMTRVELSDAERQQFYNKYVQPMRLIISEDGSVSVRLQEE